MTLALSLYLSNGLTKTVEGNQEKLIDEDPIKYRKLVEAYVDETTRPLNPLSIQDGELTYVKQVSKVIPCAFALISCHVFSTFRSSLQTINKLDIIS